MEIIYLPRFAKVYRKIPEKVRVLAEKKEKIFRANMYDARLNTHALSGELEGRWSFSVNYHYRIIFRFYDEKTVIFLMIGTHEIYK